VLLKDPETGMEDAAIKHPVFFYHHFDRAMYPDVPAPTVNIVHFVTIQHVAGEERKTTHCNSPGVLHMRERGLRSVLVRT
jgi:hypothetical protein